MTSIELAQCAEVTCCKIYGLEFLPLNLFVGHYFVLNMTFELRLFPPLHTFSMLHSTTLSLKLSCLAALSGVVISRC